MPPLNGAGMLPRHSCSHGSKAVAVGQRIPPASRATFFVTRLSTLVSCLGPSLQHLKIHIAGQRAARSHPLEASSAGSGRERSSDVGAPLGVPSGGASPAPTSVLGGAVPTRGPNYQPTPLSDTLCGLPPPLSATPVVGCAMLNRAA